MTRYTALAVLLAAMLGRVPVSAQDRQAAIAEHFKLIAQCSVIKGDPERLTCFDAVANKADVVGLARPQPLPVPTEGTGKWGAYTLYRDSPKFPEMRIHVATFDAADGEDYNRENCDIARQLFANQGVAVRYWCGRGRFNK
jgi:hypothetical protein